MIFSRDKSKFVSVSKPHVLSRYMGSGSKTMNCRHRLLMEIVGSFYAAAALLFAKELTNPIELQDG
jgi:hypothetical protein